MMGITLATGVVLALALAGGVGLSASLVDQYSAQAAGTTQPSPSAPTQDGEPSGEPGDPTEVSTPGELGSPSQDPESSQPPGHDSGPNEGSDDELREDVIHQVVRGDTLSSLSAKYSVSVDQLAEYNEIADVNLIYSGSALRVPYSLIPQVDPETGEIVLP